MPTRNSDPVTSPVAKAIIFDCRASGLGNRLRALVGYKAWSNLRGVPFHLYWEPNARCNAQVSDLFQDDFFTPIAPEQIAALVATGAAEAHTSLDWFNDIWEQRVQGEFAWDRFAREVRHCFDAMRTRPHLAQRVDDFAAANDLGRVVGLHIRHTDNLKFYSRWGASKPGVFEQEHISELEGFITVIEQNRGTRRCLLCTDDHEIEQLLRQRYGSSLLIFPKEYLEPDGKTSIRTSSVENALVEMHLLARCAEVVGTYYSSFSKLSAVWGGADFFEIRGRDKVRNPIVQRIQIAMGSA